MRRFIALWLILLTLSWYPVQAALTYSAESQYLSTASMFVASAPMTVCAWAYPTDLTANLTMFSIITTANDTEYFSLRLGGTVANDPFEWVARTTAAGFASARGTTVPSVNTWYHVCGVEAASNSRRVYVNGVEDATDGATRAPASLNEIRIARRGTGASDRERWRGTLGDVVVYNNVALAAGEIAALAGGANPFHVRPANLVSWVPAWDTTSAPIDLAAPRAWTLNGTPANATFGPPAGLFSRR